MFFKATCKDSVYYFDNLLSVFYDEHFNKINLKCLNNSPELTYLNNRIIYDTLTPNFYLNRTEPINRSQGFKDRKIIRESLRWFDVIIGNRCNFKCKYCIQRDHKDNTFWDKESFYEKVCKSGIDFKNCIDHVRIWGGESLVYWDRLKDLVDILRNKLNYEKTILVITNGSLFTEEIHSFCMEHDLKVIFSHDGPAHKYYRNINDYLDHMPTKKAVIKQLQAKQSEPGISHSGTMFPVIGPRNYDIKTTIKWFNNKLYEGVPILIDTVFKSDTSNDFILKDYTEESWKSLKDNLIYILNSDESDPYHVYYWRLKKIRDSVARHLLFEMPYASLLARCPSHNTQERICTDIEGNLLACYANKKEFKTVEGTLDNLDNVKYNMESLQSRSNCLSCPYVVACMGMCPWIPEEDHLIRCKSQQPYVEALFESSFELLFKKPILKLEALDETHPIYSVR